MEKEEFKSVVSEALEKVVSPSLKAINMRLDNIERDLADKPGRDEVHQMLRRELQISLLQIASA